ncbi:unnamed protein product [Nesidiocoris tenuis]|uniref:Uncharacterized protein n=1 Tax=Nesidiocoris tenuis TaxID=355587 RepID=A0A6H5HPD6_9HEMI|nr:unnamed protein product [Nesidiocoris tenuis]
MDLWDGQQPYVEARALALPELQQEHNKREVFPHLSLPTGWPGHYVVLWYAVLKRSGGHAFRAFRSDVREFPHLKTTLSGCSASPANSIDVNHVVTTWKVE